LANRELDAALADCNAGLKTGPRNSLQYESRALVLLRRGDLDRSIADFKTSLKLQPKSAFTLYGLGVAEIRKGLRADGERDIQAATAINPIVAQRYQRIGLTP
jgi:tetratricopeptide (TPR) repeat protein